jgi:cell division protein FtsB
LRQNLAIEAGTTVAFQLEKQIGQFEAEREQLAQQIEKLENSLQ